MGTANESLVLTTPPPEDENLFWELSFQNSSRFWVQRVLVPIVVLFGVLGNLITIYILTRRPMRSSTNVYLCALAVSDLLFLLFTFTMSLTHYPDLTATSWLYWSYKRFGLWLTDASSSTSVWLTVSFTVERYIAVCHPMRGKILCTEERAIKVAIIVFVLCFMATSPTPFEWMIVNETSTYENETLYDLTYSEFGSNDTYVSVYYWFTSLMFTLLPIILLTVFNTFLILAVRHSRIMRKVMTNLDNSSARHLQAMRQENRITVTLIVVVIVFLVCQLPTATFLIYSIFHPAMSKRDIALHRGLGGIFNLLMTVNAAINFLLYTALSDKYRKYFCEFLFFWRRRPGRGGRRGLYDSPYEMDTINTTVSSLSRGTSLRTTIRHDVSPSPRSTPSPYGLRRTQTTCGSTGNKQRPELSSVKIVGGNNSLHIKDSHIPLIQVDQV